MLAEADHRAVGNLRTYYQFPGEPSPTSDVPLSSPTSAEHVWGQNVSMRSAQHPSYRTFHDPTLTFPVNSPPLSYGKRGRAHVGRPGWSRLSFGSLRA